MTTLGIVLVVTFLVCWLGAVISPRISALASIAAGVEIIALGVMVNRNPELFVAILCGIFFIVMGFVIDYIDRK